MNSKIYSNPKNTSSKSVDKILTKKISENMEKFNFNYIDDTNLEKKLIYNFKLENLNESQENEDTSFSKNSKESNNSEKNYNEYPSPIFIINENSLEFLVKKRKVFDNLKTNHISFKVIVKKKRNEIKKESKLSIIPKNDIYDENKKFDFLLKIKPKGLLNLGGCCYMNATLQCFYHIKELTYYFLDNKKEIKRKNGILSLGYLDLVEGLSKLNKDRYYVPKKFKDSLLEIDDSFSGSEGKDSGDLIELFLYTCQQELGGDADLPDLSIDQRNLRLIYLDLFYQNSKARSIINELFNFESMTTSKCFYCGIPFYNVSSENYIIFNLEGVYNFFGKNDKKKEEENKKGNFIFFNSDNNRRVSVEECLTCFALDGALREDVICNYCKKNTSILTVRSFLTLPKIMIMIMNRGEMEKFECDVDFEEEIDFSGLYTNIKGIDKENNTKYSLLSGTILYGSHGYGHTVAFCKHFDGEYYIFNDSTARKSSFAEIKNSKIYLLFYKKIE